MITSQSFAKGALLATSVFLAACQQEEDPPTPDTPPPNPIPTVEGYGFHIERSDDPVIVPRTLAGANYLAPNDRLEGTFGPRAESLDVQLLRWPGGGLTESWEDFLDTYIIGADTRDWNSFTHNEPWSLENFLSWTQARNITPTMVLPTKRYVDASGVIDYDRAGRELGAFVREVTSGRFGTYRAEIWELGNEFMWGDDKISEEAYADLSAYLLPILRDAAQHPIEIGVQAGRLGDGRIARVASRFTSAEKQNVDFLIDHIYVRNFDWDNYLSRFQMYRNTWGDKPLYISEWNVKATQSADLSFYAYGIEQAAPVLRVWDNMVLNNVEYGAFWAVQQNTWTSAYPREQEYPDIEMYYGGAIFDWMTDTAGQERLDTTQIGDDGMFATAYYDDDNITLFVAGLEAGNQQVTVLLPDFDIQNVNAIRMTGERDRRRGHPTYYGMSPLATDGKIIFTINSETDQEVVKIILAGTWQE